MQKKTANLLITALIVFILGGALLYQVLPFLLSFAASSVYSILFLAGLILFVYVIYVLVRYFNK
ncbi:MAG: hypothetical protein ACKV1O_28840 [Saprospiraceae bacterium]